MPLARYFPAPPFVTLDVTMRLLPRDEKFFELFNAVARTILIARSYRSRSWRRSRCRTGCRYR